MKKIFLLFLFFNFYNVAFNQIIEGTVFDQNTKKPIESATVYFNGTSVGTSSDHNGNFKLDITKNIYMPLTISAIGYFSVTHTDYFSTKKPINIYLKPKAYELKPVVIKDKSLAKQRKKNLALFKAAFLGLTRNAKNCEILNQQDITFNYGSDKDTLTASALKPIHINNINLGYKITYFLDYFKLNRRDNSFCFTGNIIFNDLAKEAKNEKAIKRRRKEAYLGSRMHFFRALWDNKLEPEGFLIKNSSGLDLTYKDLVLEKDNCTKFLYCPKNDKTLHLQYKQRNPSRIYFHKNKVTFEKNGFFNADHIEWEGQMGEERIGDWLPYEYVL